MDHRQRPRLHGRDHLPGGADPIAGLQIFTPGDLADTIGSIGGCMGWWRMGDAAPSYPPDDGSDHTVTDVLLDQLSYFGTPNNASYIEPQSVSGWDVSRRPTWQVPHAGFDADDGALEFTAVPGLTPAASQGAPYCVTSFSTGHGGTSADGNPYMFGTGTDSLRTIMCWVRPAAYGTSGNGFAFGNFASGGGFGFQWEGRTGIGPLLGIHYPDDSIYQVAYDDDTWYFLAATYDDATGDIDFYINNALEDTGNTAPYNAGLDGFFFGRGVANIGTDLFYVGALDECMHFNVKLSPTEMGAIMTAGGAGLPQAGYVWTTDADGNGSWQPPALQVLASAPTSPSLGLSYFDTGLGELRVWDGSAWQSVPLS